MRLTAICNKPKWIISVSSGLKLIQMISEPYTRQYANEDVGPSKGGLWDPTSVGERNGAFLIRVWKPLPSRDVLKLWGWRQHVRLKKIAWHEQGKLPNAFYGIKDLEAQNFVKKCLENVSKRVPAKELLLDPFLASSNNNGSHQEHFLCSSQTPNNSMSRRTDMVISGSMNPNDDTVFLKVHIKVKNGKYR